MPAQFQSKVRIADSRAERRSYVQVEHGKLRAMQGPEVFVIAPFNRELEPVLEVVRRAAEDVGYKVVRLDDMAPGALFTSFVLDRIRQADVIVADLTRQSSSVMYELGYAHALRKPTILLLNSKSDGSELPVDLAGFRYFLYDPADLGQLALRMKSEIQKTALRRSA